MEWLDRLSQSISYIEDNLAGEIKVIDLALKYGYDSPTSFIGQIGQLSNK